MYSALTYDVMKSYPTRVCVTRKFVIAILYWKQGLVGIKSRGYSKILRKEIVTLYSKTVMSRFSPYFFSSILD